MMNCDMCGKEEELFVTLVEGTELTVCKSCAAHGKILKKAVPKAVPAARKPAEQEEPIEMIVKNFGKLIRDKREELGLKQEELAKKINEKVSVIHQIETKELEPSIALAKKLGKFLHIHLVEEYEEKGFKAKKTKSESFTLGDFIRP